MKLGVLVWVAVLEGVGVWLGLGVLVGEAARAGVSVGVALGLAVGDSGTPAPRTGAETVGGRKVGGGLELGIGTGFAGAGKRAAAIWPRIWELIGARCTVRVEA